MCSVGISGGETLLPPDAAKARTVPAMRLSSVMSTSPSDAHDPDRGMGFVNAVYVQEQRGKVLYVTCVLEAAAVHSTDAFDLFRQEPMTTSLALASSAQTTTSDSTDFSGD